MNKRIGNMFPIQCNFITKFSRAESGLGALTAIFIFSIMIVSFNAWKLHHQKNQLKIYQYEMALEVANNQINLLAAKQPCQNKFTLNQIAFKITCTKEQISVYYPLGELHLK